MEKDQRIIDVEKAVSAAFGYLAMMVIEDDENSDICTGCFEPGFPHDLFCLIPLDSLGQIEEEAIRFSLMKYAKWHHNNSYKKFYAISQMFNDFTMFTPISERTLEIKNAETVLRWLREEGLNGHALELEKMIVQLKTEKPEYGPHAELPEDVFI